ncbi:ABC transporter substrate-binding protein [Sphingobacterium deserti]|uniref:Iron ABC transporter periplasmic substrate-binding protein n=1 Tax=Sphingobacterium deserti TaxID=1229276 RepID=A0A0B8T5U9_9SPHI|nr:ABC transporter substrate-binding protein [Sphingobacterium deserti]KGE12305.1 iron ABC transporter periplasmic substrate-binding protein [Sphingobacterium deserti]
MKFGELFKILFCLVFIISVILLVGMIASCGSESKKAGNVFEISAVDKRGKTIALKKTAERVVVLFEPFVDQMYMLGAKDMLIGIPQQIYQNESTYQYLSLLDKRIEEKTIATPTFGGRSSNVEHIVSLQADLAIVYEHDTETIEQLEELGIPVYAVSSAGKKQIYQELIGVATLLGKEDRAREIVDYIEQQIDMMIAQHGDERKKIYYAWSKGRIFSTSGKGTLIDLAMEIAGAENACPLVMDAPNVNAESLYKWNPDIIVLWNSRLEDVYNLTELSSLNAVTQKQVFEAAPTFYYDPHTVKFLLLAKQLKSWCYPSYKKTDFDNECTEVLHFLYGNELGRRNR